MWSITAAAPDSDTFAVAAVVVVTMAESEWHGRFRGEVGVEDCLFGGADILGYVVV